MTEGISLNFDKDNNASVEIKETLQECFGGVMCPFLKRKPDKIILNGNLINIEYMLCKHVDKYVTRLKKCPLKRWLKMATPFEPLV